MLDIARLRILREFAIRGTITGVAESLNYSSSAVSQQLSKLERETGVTLLRKVGRGLELTPTAEMLVHEAEALLAHLERVDTALKQRAGDVSGTVRVAVFQTAIMALMPQALKMLETRHPSLRIEMAQVEPENALHETWAHGFDLVVAEQYPGHSVPHLAGLDRVPLMYDSIWLALPQDAVADNAYRGVRHIQDAANLPWVMEPRGAASRHWAEQTCRVAGFEPDVRYETADVQAHLKLVETGNAVAFISGLARSGSDAQLRFVDVEGSPQRTIFTAIRMSTGAHPALTEIRNTFAEVAAEFDLSP